MPIESILQPLLIVAIAVVITLVITDRRYAAKGTGESSELVVSSLPLQGRPTASVEQRSIQPVISADGTVSKDGNDYVLIGSIGSADVVYHLVVSPPPSIKALIQGGPAGFDCAWKGLVPTQGAGEAARPDGTGGTSGTTAMAVECVIPASVKVVEGLAGTMVLALATPKTVNALPLTAVFGGAQSGTVIVVNADGTTSARPVTLGVSDNTWIEVTSGLKPGEQVLLYPVQADLTGS